MTSKKEHEGILERCPFCNGEPQYFEMRGSHFIQCKSGIGSAIKHNVHAQTKEEVIKEWNTRTEERKEFDKTKIDKIIYWLDLSKGQDKYINEAKFLLKELGPPKESLERLDKKELSEVIKDIDLLLSEWNVYSIKLEGRYALEKRKGLAKAIYQQYITPKVEAEE